MSFALITGGSKGIGKAIAEELALKGFNILLVSRSEENLKQTAEEISSNYKVHTAYLPLDLSAESSARKVVNWCQSEQFDISILVNNAGYGLSGKFESYSLEEHQAMMRINMDTVIQLSYLFLPQLKQQKQAYILNIASSAAYQAVPFLSVYAATKAFILQFSRGLKHELKGTSVSVTCVSPGSTDTEFASRAKVGPKAMKAADKVNMHPRQVASIAVKSLFAKKSEVVVGFINKLGAFFVWLLPKSLVEKTAANLYQ
ncbi:MAG: SDR family NAD(P)-dependent oxidoreductase [Candidatus Dadabacteria bacterium]